MGSFIRVWNRMGDGERVGVMLAILSVVSFIWFLSILEPPNWPKEKCIANPDAEWVDGNCRRID